MGTIHGFSYQVRNEIALSLLPSIDGDGLFGIGPAARSISPVRRVHRIPSQKNYRLTDCALCFLYRAL